jgi:4-hydroxybenzoate polyprenyltransferase
LTLYSVVLLIVLILSNIPTLIFSLFITLGGILYTDYFKEIGAKKIVGFKNFYTSSFGAMTIFIIPLFYGLRIDLFFICLVIFVFMRLIVNAVFFDIKDIVSDKERGLKTFAVVLGKKKTLFLLQTINLGTIIPLIFGIYFNNYPKSYIILGSLAIYSVYYLTRAYFIEGKELRNLSYFIVDAEYIFWPILIILARQYS